MGQGLGGIRTGEDSGGGLGSARHRVGQTDSESRSFNRPSSLSASPGSSRAASVQSGGGGGGGLLGRRTSSFFGVKRRPSSSAASSIHPSPSSASTSSAASSSSVTWADGLAVGGDGLGPLGRTGRRTRTRRTSTSSSGQSKHEDRSASGSRASRWKKRFRETLRSSSTLSLDRPTVPDHQGSPGETAVTASTAAAAAATTHEPLVLDESGLHPMVEDPVEDSTAREEPSGHTVDWTDANDGQANPDAPPIHQSQPDLATATNSSPGAPPSEQILEAQRQWATRAAAEYASLIGRRMLVQGMVVADIAAPHSSTPSVVDSSTPAAGPERQRHHRSASQDPLMVTTPWYEEPFTSFRPRHRRSYSAGGSQGLTRSSDVQEPTQAGASTVAGSSHAAEAGSTDAGDPQSENASQPDRASNYQAGLLSRLLAVTAFATARNLLSHANLDGADPTAGLQPFGALLRSAFMQHASELNAASGPSAERAMPSLFRSRSSDPLTGHAASTSTASPAWGIGSGIGRFLDRLRPSRRPTAPDLTLQAIPGGDENGFNAFVRELAAGHLARLVRHDSMESSSEEDADALGLPGDANFLRLFRFPDRALASVAASAIDRHLDHISATSASTGTPLSTSVSDSTASAASAEAAATTTTARPSWLPENVPTSVIPIIIVGIRQLGHGEDLPGMSFAPGATDESPNRGQAGQDPSTTEEVAGPTAGQPNATPSEQPAQRPQSDHSEAVANHETATSDAQPSITPASSTPGPASSLDDPANARWMIVVLSGHYPPHHPILTEPSFFTDQPTYEDLLALSALIGTVVKQSVTQAQIDADKSTRIIDRALDRPIIEDDLIIVGTERLETKGGTERQCRICLMEYDSADQLRLLKCHHCFHRECCDHWLTKSKNSCPMCRARVIQTEEPSSSSPLTSASSSPLVDILTNAESNTADAVDPHP